MIYAAVASTFAAMHSRHALPDWNSLAACGDDELPLLDTALLIARDEYPSLDAGEYAHIIEGYADAVRPKLAAVSPS